MSRCVAKVDSVTAARFVGGKGTAVGFRPLHGWRVFLGEVGCSNAERFLKRAAKKSGLHPKPIEDAANYDDRLCVPILPKGGG